MRILFVTPAFDRGGATEACTVELATRLGERHEVHVMAATNEGGLGHGLTYVPVAAANRPFPALIRYVSFLVASTRALRRLGVPHRRRFDIVHATGGDCLYADVMTAHYCQAQRLRLVRTRRIRVEAGHRPAAVDVFLQHVYMRVVPRFERMVYRRPTLARAIAVSAGLRANLIEHYGCRPEQVVTIPNGIDLARFPAVAPTDERRSTRQRYGFDKQHFVLLFLGGDWGRKGLRHCIRALAQVVSPHVRLLVAGRGETSRYRELAAQLGIADRVVFAGHVAPQPHLYAADALVMPSAYEAFSVATLEAAAAGLPLIVTRINGTEELVEHGVSGFFVEEDPADIAARVDLLEADRHRAREMGARARKRVEERYTWDSVVSTTERLYEVVLAERRGSSRAVVTAGSADR